MMSSMNQQNSVYGSIVPANECIKDFQYDHLSQPFHFLDLSNKMSSINGVKRTKLIGDNWYQNGIKSNQTNIITGDDTDSNGSFSKLNNNNNNDNENNHSIDNSCGGDDEKVMQEHHARRPMNAFLIFCKRHRNIVRERYPNLENRAITKILGDWWANLSEQEKSCYTNLAKDYKDAFFHANPDFKWYKLPAPPLRSVSYNRSNSGSSDLDAYNRSIDHEVDHQLEKSSSNVNTFKLADETQMGGLNSLMVAADIVRSITNNNYKLSTEQSNGDNEIDGLNNKNELHRVLGETGNYLQNTMKDFSDHSDVFSFDISSTNKNIPQNRIRSKTSSSSDFESFDDDMNGGSEPYGGKKSTRSCKGKKYMEFMNAQRASVITKRITKPNATSTSSSASSSPTEIQRSFVKPMPFNGTVQKMEFEQFDHLYASSPLSKQSTEMKMPDEQNRSDVGDFELEQKISALQAQNIDDYLSRKQNTKKKKKGSSDKRSSGRKMHRVTKSKVKSINPITSTPIIPVAPIIAPKTIQEAKDCLNIVGSQKRKARKESITRRDVQQINAIVQNFHASNPFSIDLPDSNETRCSASGLLMLATMAEVTANYGA